MMAIDKLAWIYVRERRVLSTRTRGRSLFYLPGGKREAGESDTQALEREILEELQVALDPATIRPFGVFEAQADSHPDDLLYCGADRIAGAGRRDRGNAVARFQRRCDFVAGGQNHPGPADGARSDRLRLVPAGRVLR